ncbi:sorting nexin lst-4-like isoform X2 [Gigantopelta aegis]|uniref:sorting nexin lst-4-like isoform X2 n=1 Tax=Gigantopelta aegis TaxID=1735272 RepID=UPI001B88753B|nr:sorting nexin lst-4-like isoform X2 [Gigantopelta aegis]
MAEIQATALYDFDGDKVNGELSFHSGDALFILRQDIGDGWWEARNQQGQQGLVPESYVEIISIPEPQFPPPPPPIPATVPSTRPTSIKALNGYTQQNGGDTGNQVTTQQSFDDWDDEWDDDDDDQSSNSTTGTNQDLHGSGTFGLSVPRREGKQISPTLEMSKYGTVKSSFNRFSHFAKTGGEAYLMTQVQVEVPESDLIKIIEADEGPVWNPIRDPYTCSVASPKKESKMKGLKSYIAYHLTPSFNNIQVSRRYKHFDWLHERLQEKFPCITVPPLPDKAISGRYEDDFITERMQRLQLWINRMVQHPVVSQSSVFIHFLTCTDEKRWKQGKRKSEKDEYQGARFFLLLQTPPHHLDMADVDKKMENFCKFVMNMTENTKFLLNGLGENCKKYTGSFKKEFSKLGHGFKTMAVTFNLDQNAYSQNLTAAIDQTGDTYREIGKMYEEQPMKDILPLMDSLGEYKGILQTFPDVLKVHEGATGKAKECIKQKEDQKMSESEVQLVMQKADVISYGTLAEINHFQRERVSDYKLMMQSYLQAQISFYREITTKLEQALQHFDNA